MHETRAVWVATNFGLDFPKNIRDQAAQQTYLRNIFRTIKEKNYNTVYFQVRANGSVFFNSDIEPYNSMLTGMTGGIPSYDPSQLAIDLAREYGLEIHAWVNTFRCFSGGDREPLLDDRHPVKSKPELVKSFYEGSSLSYWMDPGEPASRDYLVNLFTELMSHYNFDGIQLDFVRYPGRNFDDQTSYTKYGNGKNKSDWRRGNITSFISDLKANLVNIDPNIKLGATPIGIYKNPPGFHGFEGYNDVYQDVEAWINNKLLDYVVPQIYWNIKSDPKFDVVTSDWMKIKKDCRMIIGIAAYKDDVKREINNQVEVTRSLGADGQAYFRYENIAGLSIYNDKAFPAPYLNKEPLYLPEPFNLNATVVNGENYLKWEFDTGYENKLRYFAVYEMSGGRKELVDFVTPSNREIALSGGSVIRESGYYSVGCIDLNWNESYGNKAVKAENKKLQNILVKADAGTRPLLKKTEGGFILTCYSESRENLKVTAGNSAKVLYQKTSVSEKGVNMLYIPLDTKPDYIEITFPDRGESRRLTL